MTRPENRQTAEKRMALEGRLPPGQSLTQKFPVLHFGSVPRIDLKQWQLKIWGEVENQISWSWEEFNKLPQMEVVMDIHCVTRWSKFNTSWRGVSLKSLVEDGLVQPLNGAAYVLQHAVGGYTTNLPLEITLQDNFLLATHFNGQPITPDHGFPVRGIVGQIPDREDLKTPYFWKGAKWLTGLEFLTEDQLGFWEEAGYHNEGDVWKEQRRR